jgi:hypothetical protein
MMLLAVLLLSAAEPPAGAAATCLIVGRQLDYKLADESTLLAGGGTGRGCPAVARG